MRVFAAATRCGQMEGRYNQTILVRHRIGLRLLRSALVQPPQLEHQWFQPAIVIRFF
jgi:hypothetical protein